MSVEIFRKDRKHWTDQDLEQIDVFYQCNGFFSSFYQLRYLDDIVNMSYYAKLEPEQPLYLTDNKRSAAVIVLKGNVRVHKKQSHFKKSKLKYGEEWKHVGDFLGFNQTIELHTESKLAALHNKQAEVLFVPTFLYNAYIAQRHEQETLITYSLLGKVFKSVEKKPLLELARSGCTLCNVRINNYVYREGEKPDAVYIILEGSVKVERSGYSDRTQDIVVMSPEALIGDQDICFAQREANTICCSAESRLLKIPKNGFLKFAKVALPDYRIPTQPRYGKSRSKELSSKKTQKHFKLPEIIKFQSSHRTKEQQARQIKFIKNSHILLEVSSPKSDRIRSRSSVSDYPKDIMEEKIKLYKKIRPKNNKLDLSNRIF